MPKGFSELEKELIQRRLLEQGHAHFSTYGLKKTTIDELAQASGISKGAFYLFYESKEALFMDVIEETERRFRQELLAAIGPPGPSPRARLLALLRKAFALFKTMPMLQFFTGGDYDLLLRRIPPEKLAQHVTSDRSFLDELIAACQAAGIPIRVRGEEMSALAYVLVLGAMHKDDWGAGDLGAAVDVLLELIAAYALGEIVLDAQNPFHRSPEGAEGS